MNWQQTRENHLVSMYVRYIPLMPAFAAHPTIAAPYGTPSDGRFVDATAQEARRQQETSIGAPQTVFENLVKTALATAPAKSWNPMTHISEAKNAHLTNKPSEMDKSLKGDFNYFEGDIRMDRSGVPIMAHDKDDRTGLTLEQWLAIGAASQRGMKMDIKESSAINHVLDAAFRSGIPHQRLLFNIGVLNQGLNVNASMEQLVRTRRMFPTSIINLSFPLPYTSSQIERVGAIARSVGGPIMFPLQAQFVNASVVSSLKRFGMVAIWNDPSSYNPSNIDADTRRYRSMGVDGMIDLRKK